MKLLRLGHIALAVVSLLILAGCGGGNSSTAPSATSDTVPNASTATVVAIVTTTL